MIGSDMLEALQADALAVLRNTPALADANILSEDDGDTEAKILRALGALSGGSTGKRGLVLVILLPEVTASEPNLPGPPLMARLEIQVIEHAVVNRATGGTGMRSSQAAAIALGALHHYASGNRLLVAADAPLSPLRAKTGYFSHVIALNCRLSGVRQAPKPANVAAAWMPDDTLRLSCMTPGAEIYYTTDGGYPSPGNPTATRYTGDIAGLTVGTVIRAAAWSAGMAPGNVIELTVTDGEAIMEDLTWDGWLTNWDGWGPDWNEL